MENNKPKIDLSRIPEWQMNQLFSFLQKHKFITDDNRSHFFYAMVELCYQRTHSADFYQIDLDFIMKLGRSYLSVLSGTKFLL